MEFNMHLKPITLSAALFFSLSYGNVSEAKLPVNNATTVNRNEGDLAEWELLKAYLSEVEKRSDLEIATAKMDYKLRREIFQESNRRWWEIYKEDQKKEKIRLYWDRFRSGEDYAHSVVSKSVGSYCKLLDKVDLSSMNSPIEDGVIYSAFSRGFKGAYPECSIANLDQFLRDTDKKISVIEGKITEIKKGLLVTRPTEKEVEVIYNELKKKYVEAVKAHLATSKERLEKSFNLPVTEMKRLIESANTLSAAINCSTLKSRLGSRYNCAIQVIDAPVKLGAASTYRVLTNQQETGAFQPQIYLGQLLMATAVYLKEVNPNDEMVKYLVSDINLTLAKIQNASEKRMEDARVLIAEDFFNQMRSLKIDTIDLNRGVFSKDIVMGIIDNMLAIKPALKSYMRLDMSTEYERSILTKVLKHYRSTLNLAGSLQAKVQLPHREVIVTLEDEETSDVVTLAPMPFPPTAYLLGLSPKDVQEWMEFLAL
jgi:ligand-binding sensor protein